VLARASHGFDEGATRWRVRSVARVNELWGIGEHDVSDAKIAAGEGITSEDVADAVRYMLGRPRQGSTSVTS